MQSKKIDSINSLFYPKTVAVIGASRAPGKIGHVIMQNFIGSKFRGKVIPINPTAKEVLGEKCFPSVKKVKEKIDSAVICIPAQFVPQAFKECCEKKIRSVTIISAGFREVGRTQEENQINELMKKYPETRIIGPNCLGILNCENGVDSVFLPEYRLERPKAGEVAFISQSGALGSAVLDWASMKEYGISKFVSYGNAIDLDETDFLEYFIQDKKTKVIVMYIEGVKNGRKFLEATKKYSSKKPIIILKGGVTDEGSKAVSSHTGSLAGSNQVFNALFKQTALIKAENLLELFDYARVLSKQPKPMGNRVQIITDGGGYGVVTADNAVQEGLRLAKMKEKYLNEIRKVVPSYAVLGNPIDLTGDVTNERYRVAVEQALADDGVDLLIIILLFQVPTLDSDIIEVITELNNKKKKPMICISVGGSYSQIHKQALEREGVITFSYPDNAVKSLKALVEFYGRKNKNKKIT